MKRPIFIDIDMVELADWNYKKNDKKMMETLKAQIQENGFVENIIVREKVDGRYEVINGNHRIECLKAIGEHTVAAINVGPISLIGAKRIAIETNETRFQKDEKKLGNLLSGIKNNVDLEDLKKTMPFSEDALLELTGEFDSIEGENTDLEEKESKDTGVLTVGVEKFFEELSLYDVDKKVALDFIKWAKKYIKDREIKTFESFLKSLF